MKLTLSEPKYLKDSLSIISEIVTEATFRVKKDVVELVAMDPANVALVVFRLVSSAFVTYEVDEATDLTVNLNNFKQVLRRVKTGDTLTLEVEENKLKVVLQSTSQRTFYLPLIDADEEEQNVPDLSFSAEISTLPSVFNDAIDDVDVVGESVTLGADEKTLYVSSKGDLTEAAVEIPGDKTTSISCNDDNIKAKYSIEYLKKMMQGSKLSDAVSIKFAKDYPLRIEYVVKDKLELAFILAPRVDND